MLKDEIRERLKGGGDWLGGARNWLLWKKDPHGRLTFGSEETVTLTMREIEALALEAAVGGVLDSRRMKVSD